MASLRETKDRIGSVKSTLKITSAMKLVASSKLRKAQNAIESLRPYEAALREILISSMSGVSSKSAVSSKFGASSEAAEDSQIIGVPLKPAVMAEEGDSLMTEVTLKGTSIDAGYENAQEDFASPISPKVAVIAISSNSSLCGGFNANAIKTVTEQLRGLAAEGSDVVVYSIGRKMADAMKKAGYPSPADYSEISARPSYAEAAGLAGEIYRAFAEGKYSRVLLVYNHFVSTSKQKMVVEQYLPFEMPSKGGSLPENYFIFEPDAGSIVSELLPKVINLKLFASLLDSAAAEHAARTVAMQTATDNAQELLGDLTLEYNKGRQQKITAEILDLLGGMR